MRENEISRVVVDVAIRIHRTFGPGLLESAYESILDHELRQSGLSVRRQVSVSLIWDGIEMGNGYIADLIVEDLVIIELKAVEKHTRLHARQLHTYLKLSGLKLGLLLNFGTEMMKDGIERVVNNLPEN